MIVSEHLGGMGPGAGAPPPPPLGSAYGRICWRKGAHITPPVQKGTGSPFFISIADNRRMEMKIGVEVGISFRWGGLQDSALAAPLDPPLLSEVERL